MVILEIGKTLRVDVGVNEGIAYDGGLYLLGMRIGSVSDYLIADFLLKASRAGSCFLEAFQ